MSGPGLLMRSPRFWDAPPSRPGPAARLLTPLAWIWTAETRRRLAAVPPARVGVPVVCVGNLTVGGTGKTPAVIAICDRLRARGLTPHVISRGHGGTLKGPRRVDPEGHTATEAGDEPLLLAAFGPVWVGRDRFAAGRAAAADGADILVMDDGFQNPGLAKDLSIVVIDALHGFGNGRVIPAGPLREPVDAGLARADLTLAVGAPRARDDLREAWPALAALPMMGGTLEPLATGMDWRGARVLAFAGIGRPEKFFATLRDLGVELVATHGFADHASFDPKVLARLTAEARAAGAQLVTTEKDAVRLPPAFLRDVLVLPVRLEIEDWTPFDDALDRIGNGRIG